MSTLQSRQKQTSEAKTHVPYVYNLPTPSITLTGWTGSIEEIKSIRNITTNELLHDISRPNTTGTLAGNILTLNASISPAGQNSTDKLEILVEKLVTPVSLTSAQLLALTPITGGATEATLGLIKTKTDNLDVLLSDLIDLKTKAKGSTPAGNPTSTNIDVNTQALDVRDLNITNGTQITKLGKIDYTLSTNNSSTTNITVTTPFTGVVQDALQFPTLVITVLADQPTTINVLQYSDSAGTKLVETSTFNRLANTGLNTPVKLSGNYFKVTVQNTGLATTTNFLVESWMGILETLPTSLTNKGNLKVSIEEGGSIDRTLSIAPYSNRLSDGTVFYDARQTRALTATDVVSLSSTNITTLTPPVNTGYALDTSVNSLLKPASTLSAVTTLGTITNALPTGTNTIGNTNQTLATAEFAKITDGTNTATVTSLGALKVDSGVEKDLFITGLFGQSALNNNILLTTNSAGWLDTMPTDGVSYQSFQTQITGSNGISAGQILFEGTNDPTVLTAPILFVNEDSNTTGSFIINAQSITANSIRYFSGKTGYRYIRCRITTPFSGGTIQAFTRLSPELYIPRVNNTTIGQPLPNGSNNIGQTGLLNNFAVPDLLSAAITGSGNVGPLSPGWGTSYQVNIPVTAISGTAPTMDITIQESDDGGTNWFNVYTYPQITAIGIYRSPFLALTGNRIRYVQTLNGTTPSFTRSINRIQSNNIVQVFQANKAFTNSTITLGGTSQVALPVNIVRKALEIQNNSAGDIWFNYNSNAGVDSGLKIGAGQTYTVPSNMIDIGTVNIWGATTAQKFVIKEY